ncbi:MAG: hypothetical protein R3C15_22775 [Thermoleophilia bacterium]
MRRKLVATGLVTGLVAAFGVVGTAAAADPPTVGVTGVTPGKAQFGLSVSVANFKLLPKQIGKKKNVKGGGHYHIFLGVVDGPTVQCNIPASYTTKWVYSGASGKPTGKTDKGAAKADTWYCMKVQLANNDHSLVKVARKPVEGYILSAVRLSKS